MRRDTGREGVILEFVRFGPVVRVSAMDPATLTEVIIQGAAAAGETALRQAALAKLAYVLRSRDDHRRALRCKHRRHRGTLVSA